MPKRPLVFPWAGRSDATALHAQPELTTRQAQNARARNPKNGRLMGAQRAGTVKFNATALGTGKVRALCSTAIDDRKVAYSFSSGAVDDVWSEPTPSKTNTVGGVTDRQGNIYVIDGSAAVAKFNSAGRLLMKVALPVADASHVVRALFVDDSDRIFAGVSSGGDVRTAAVFCVLQRPQPGQIAPDDPNQFFVLWTLTPGAYTEELRVFRGTQLYCAHNYPGVSRARVVVYDGLGLEPTEVKRIESVAYPINGFDLALSGEFYCASAPTSVGFFTKERPGPTTFFTPPLIGWTPRDDSTLKIWSWFDASDPDSLDETDLEQSGSEVTKSDGQQVLRWRDKSGNGRHWYAGTLQTVGETGPEYIGYGLGGLPNIRFDTGRTASVKHSLVSLPNASIDVNLADQQRTPIPAYTGGMWCMFLVLRPSPDSDVGTPSPRTVLALDNEVGGASDHVLFANRDSKAALPGTVDPGFLSYYATLNSGGSGTGGQLVGFEYLADSTTNHKTGAAIVALLWDGAVEPADFTKTRVAMRYNGRPVDIADGLGFASLQPQWLGAAPATIFATGMDVARRFRGEIAEMLVLERKDRTSLTEPKVLTYDQFELGFVAGTDNQMNRIEAYLAYKWGLGNVLNVFHPYGRSVAGAAAVLPGPPAPVVGGLYAAHAALLRPDGLVSKHDSNGQLRWAANSNVVTPEGGFGYGVRARKVESDSKTHVWSIGPVDGVTTGSGTKAVQKLIDNGTSFSFASGDGAWTHAFVGGAVPGYAYPRMASDKFGNIFIPGYNTGGGTLRALHVLLKDGVAGAAVQLTEVILPGSSSLAFAVALPPDALTPDYRTDLPTGPAEVAYVFTTMEASGSQLFDSVYKILLVTTNAVASGSPRTIITVGVSGTDIKTIDATTVAIPSGGAGVVDATSEYVEAFQADSEVIVLDGLRYWSYSALTGLVTALESTSAGEIPLRAKLGCMWRHRLVLARFADKPGRYTASAIGNIRDWDLRREPRLSTMAFDASLTRAGEVEDVIVALLPYSDDLLFVLGESRILRLTGDPMDGGQIDKISDDIGGTFGGSWCKDTMGRAYFFGNPPGLYGLGADGVVPLSRYTIEETEFEAIDFSTHRMELCWDPIQKGMHIFQVPHGAGGTIVNHWFWEEKTHRMVQGGAIWTDRYAVSGRQPTAATFLAGDSNRGLLLGCEDGYVRIVDKDARDDDGAAIDSFVTMGPVNASAEMLAHRLISTQVALQGDMQGCRLELFGSEELEDIGPIVAATDLVAGLNDPFRARVNAPYLWARLRSALAGRSWALERGECEFVVSSPQKNRST